jgi:hypothetical protein
MTGPPRDPASVARQKVQRRSGLPCRTAGSSAQRRRTANEGERRPPERLRSSTEWRNAAPQTDGERREQFETKRQIVKMLVQKALIRKDKTLRVICYLDVLSLLEQADVTE